LLAGLSVAGIEREGLLQAGSRPREISGPLLGEREIEAVLGRRRAERDGPLEGGHGPGSVAGGPECCPEVAPGGLVAAVLRHGLSERRRRLEKTPLLK
jgi:hypothetical protein